MMSCAKCMWFDRMGKQHVGLCRINPPVVITSELEQTDDKGFLNKPFTTWPIVREHDWCGRYELGGP